jgi:hypothetical protein
VRGGRSLYIDDAAAREATNLNAMRQQLWIFVAVGLVASTASKSADAGFNVIAGEFIELNNGPGSPGGVFHVDVFHNRTDINPKGTYDTFCVELTEHINFDTRYYIQSIGLKTINGGRTLAPQAAWLYTQFLDQNTSALAGFNFSLVAGNPSSTQARDQANALQLGIWRGLLDDSNNPMSYTDIRNLAGWTSGYVTYLKDNYLTTWLGAFTADTAWSGTGNIRIMNLRQYTYKNNTLTPTTYAQDQLVRVTPELPTVYSAGAVMSCAVLWGLIGVIRKHRVAASFN